MKRTVSLSLLVVAQLAGSGCLVTFDIGDRERFVNFTPCRDDVKAVLTVSNTLTADRVESYAVQSPRSSNLVLRLTWQDPDVRLGLRARTTACGGDSGCTLASWTPRNAMMPSVRPGVVEMSVDGWKGKAYVIDVLGDASTDVPFELSVVSEVRCDR